MSVSKEAEKIIRAGYANSLTGEAIAAQLDTAGHKTPTKRTWQGYDVSYYATQKLGLRKNKPFTKGNGNGHAAATSEPELIEIIRDIMTSNLASQTQSAILKRLMK